MEFEAAVSERELSLKVEKVDKVDKVDRVIKALWNY